MRWIADIFPRWTARCRPLAHDRARRLRPGSNHRVSMAGPRRGLLVSVEIGDHPSIAILTESANRHSTSKSQSPPPLLAPWRSAAPWRQDREPSPRSFRAFRCQDRRSICIPASGSFRAGIPVPRLASRRRPGSFRAGATFEAESRPTAAKRPSRSRASGISP